MNLLKLLKSPWRMKWYPRALLAVFGLSFCFVVFFGEGASTISGRLGGDYPAFFGAGKIVAEGDGDLLYSSKRQSAAQSKLFPEDDSVFIPFPYPPYLALFYAPLSQLDYRLSYFVHTLLMLAALLVCTSILIKRLGHAFNPDFLFLFTALLLFYPLFRGVTGGTNTALSLLLVCLCWQATAGGRQLLAGLFLGLLLFKPQFGVILMGLFLLSGRSQVVLASVVTGFLLWGAGVLISGWDWTSEWYRYAQWVTRVAGDIDAGNAVSWPGFFEAALGMKSLLASILGYGLAGLTAALACGVWWRGAGGDLNAQFGIAAVCLVLIPYHVFYYDAGLLVLSWTALLTREWRYKYETAAGLWLLGFAQPLAAWTGLSPIFLITLFTFVLAVRILLPAAIRSEPNYSLIRESAV